MKKDKKIKKDEEIEPELYRVAREKGTEPPFVGKYVHHKEKGIYKCAVCGNELFSSNAKFDPGTGWPSFPAPANLENIELKDDLSGGMRRTEVICKKCGAHLGHVFSDGTKEEGGNRYCINSICLEFEKNNKVANK